MITRTSARGALGPTTGSCVGWWCVGTVASRRFARAAAAADRELRYYVCNKRRPLEAGGPERACQQPSTRAEALDALVWDQLRQALLRPQMLVKGQAALGARTRQPDDELLRAQRERLERRLQSTETERRRLVDLYQMQAIDLAEFQTRQQEVTSRHRQFEQEREALLAQRQELAVNNRLAAKVDSFARRIRTGIDALDFEQRQKLVRLLVEQVRVTGPSVQIHLRIPLDEPSRRRGRFQATCELSQSAAPTGVQSIAFAFTWWRCTFRSSSARCSRPMTSTSLDGSDRAHPPSAGATPHSASPSPGRSPARTSSAGSAIRSSTVPDLIAPHRGLTSGLTVH